MRETLFPNVRFAVEQPAGEDGPVILTFEVPIELPGGLVAVAERIRIPFSPEAWENFERAVKSRSTTPIAITRTMPRGNGPVR